MVIIYLFLEGVICFFLAAPFFSMLISLLFPKKSNDKTIFTGKVYDFACIITAYKDASIAINLINSILDQTHSNFTIYLVADDCDVSALNLKSEKLVVLSPPQALKSKVKSIEYGIDNFQRSHDTIMIFDPDNLAHPECLTEINSYFQRGYKAVQGRRIAKNLDTFYACLDAMGEFYYNYTQRFVPFKLGSSATIAGSGMAFISQYYLDFLKNEQIRQAHAENKVIVAEDKMLQVDFVSKGDIIAYADTAIIYDEKVTSGAQVERQRTRWINSYFLHLKDGFGLLWTGFRKFNFNCFFFAYTIIIPPMFIQLGFTILFLATSLFISLNYFFLIALSFSFFISGFILALYLSKVPNQVWKSLWRIPFFVVRQVFALLKIKQSNKDFLVTEKTNSSSIQDILKQT